MGDLGSDPRRQVARGGEWVIRHRQPECDPCAGDPRTRLARNVAAVATSAIRRVGHPRSGIRSPVRHGRPSGCSIAGFVMDEAFWALGRGTGVVALLLLTLGVVLGVFTRSGRTLLGLPRFSVALVHRNVAILAGVFTLIHILSLLFDPFAQLTLVDLVVPFRGAYAPFWLGLGTVGVDLLFAIMLTALFRRWIGVRVFRFVHWFVYAMWPVAFLHAIEIGRAHV